MQQPIIKVVDSIMGSGKTSSAINLMNSDHENNYIFITPYLSEIDRIKHQCIDRRFYDPKIYSHDGQLYNKLDSLHSLLKQRKNIASTHALFKRANEETKELIYTGEYILILDEVMDVIEQLDIRKNDIDILLGQQLIYIKDGFVYWNDDKKDYDTRYNDIRDMARNNNLIMYKDSIFIWTFPIDIFKSFKEVYILTYLFDAQIQKYYYDIFNVQYEKYHASFENDQYIFKKGLSNDKQFREQIKDKINIYDGNLNKIGDKDYSLSKNWHSKHHDLLEVLKNNTVNYFKNKVKTPSKQNMWTTFKDYKGKLKGKGYTKGFVSCNIRATNDYKHKNAIAYLINYYMNPIIKGFFDSKNVTVNENLYALSELIQWVWRSSIRDGKEINLYIPSKRMRELLIRWLDNRHI